MIIFRRTYLSKSLREERFKTSNSCCYITVSGLQNPNQQTFKSMNEYMKAYASDQLRVFLADGL